MSTAAKKTVNKTVKPTKTAANDAFTSVETISDAARDQFDTIVAAFGENAEAMRGQTEEMFETARDNFETAQSLMKDMNAEFMTAAREETTEAAEFVNELARAKSLGDALEIQRDYWTNLFETRAERAREFSKTATEMARGSFEPFAKSLDAFSKAPSMDKFFPFAAK